MILGLGQKVGGAAEPVAGGGATVTYLLRDQFSTDEGAPIASPRTCEPGPGTLTLTQTDGQNTITSGRLNFPAQTTPTWGDQGGKGTSQTRTAGLAMAVLLDMSAIGSSFCAIGWFSNGIAVANMLDTFRLYLSGFQIVMRGGTPVTINVGNGNIATGIDYSLAVIARSNGSFYFIKGGIFADWTLVWVSSNESTATLYPAWSNFDQAGFFSDLKVTQLSGALASDTGIASEIYASPATGQIAASPQGGVVEFTWTPGAAETLSIYFRRTDDNNCWRLDCAQAGGTIKLYSVSAGVDTERDAGKTQTWNVGTPYRIVISKAGRYIQSYVADVRKHNYDDATLYQNGTTGVKIAGFATGSNLICWPRTYTLPNF